MHAIQTLLIRCRFRRSTARGRKLPSIDGLVVGQWVNYFFTSRIRALRQFPSVKVNVEERHAAADQVKGRGFLF